MEETGATWGHPTHTWEENATSTQKDPRQESNPGPSCCEATVQLLNRAALKYILYYIIYLWLLFLLLVPVMATKSAINDNY